MDASIGLLEKFLPPGTFPAVANMVQKHPVNIVVCRPRKTKLGDYRFPTKANPRHRISVNGNLDPAQFLITLVHEFAHLEAFHQYGRRIKPHGKEWKKVYTDMLMPFFSYFPEEIQPALQAHLNNPKASSCSDEELNRKIRAMNPVEVKDGFWHLEDFKGEDFEMESGKQMKLLKPLRKYYLCKDIQTERMYRVHPLAKVKPL